MPTARNPRHLRVGSALLRMQRRMEEAHGRAAGRASIHTTDFRCIAYLKRHDGPVSPKQINAFLGLTSGAGTALLDRLEKAGYVRRLPNPLDGRSVLIVLDEAAAADQLALLETVHDRYREAVRSFSDADLDVIAAYLDRVADMLAPEDEADPKAANRKES